MTSRPGDWSGVNFPLRFNVGSGSQADVRIADDSIGRIAVYLSASSPRDRVTLTDTQSENGVWVRGLTGFRRLKGVERVGWDTSIRLGEYPTTPRELAQMTDSTIDIFLSYAREDEAIVAQIERALVRHGWRTWRDDRLAFARPFDTELEEKLARARCVLVHWSQASIESEWVQREAKAGYERNSLAPVFLGKVQPPEPFAHVQGCFVSAESSHDIGTLIEKLATLIGKPRKKRAQS